MCGGGYAPPTAAKSLPGYALVRAQPIEFIGPKGRTKGIAQKYKGTSTAGHSHRRTSGGKAKATKGGLLGQNHRDRGRLLLSY